MIFSIDRATWSADSLAQAMAAVRNKELGLRAAAKLHGIPTTTLRDRPDDKIKCAKGSNKHFGRPPILPRAIEDELVQHILDREAMLFGLIRKSVMELAYEVAARSVLSHTFSLEKKSAGKKWLKLLLNRYKEISLRRAEAISLARASGFNQESVDRFFDLLDRESDKNGFSGVTIYIWMRQQ